MRRNCKLEKVRIYFDSAGKTLNVWFDDPKKEHISEETGKEVILIKNRQGKVIGFEKLNFLSHPEKELKDLKTIPVEVLIS